MTIAELNETFGIEGLVRFETGPGGLTRLVVTTPLAEAHIHTHGAHVTHYQPAGQEPVLWCSARSWFAPGQPIRGGVPVCFPWFGPREGDPDAPSHGFARLLEWDVFDVSADDGTVYVTLMLAASDRTRRYWPHTFALRHTVAVGEELSMTLEALNLDAAPVTITEALHSYFAVSDVREVRLTGLAGAAYIDKVDGGARKKQPPQPIRFTGETDRVYLDTRSACVLEDPGRRRRIRIDKDGSDSTVVWNPWTDKAARMPDFGDDEWPGMVCIETANAHDNAVRIPPGQSRTMQAVVSVEPL